MGVCEISLTAPQRLTVRAPPPPRGRISTTNNEPALLAQNRTMHELANLLLCLENDSCKPGQTQVIIANWGRFCEYLAGGVSGENIW